MKQPSEIANYALSDLDCLIPVEGAEVIITGYHTGITPYGKVVIIRVDDGRRKLGVVASSKRIRDTLERMASFPVRVRFRRDGCHWLIEVQNGETTIENSY